MGPCLAGSCPEAVPVRSSMQIRCAKPSAQKMPAILGHRITMFTRCIWGPTCRYSCNAAPLLAPYKANMADPLLTGAFSIKQAVVDKDATCAEVAIVQNDVVSCIAGVRLPGVRPDEVLQAKYDDSR